MTPPSATRRYQKNAPHTSLDFPPGSSWLVYTDQVLHAALKGEFALEQTFHFDVAEMGEPDQAPIRVLGTVDGKGARIDSGARDFRSWLGASRGACA